MRRAPKGLIANPVMMLALVYFFSNLHSFFILISGQEIFIDSLIRGFDDSVVYAAGIALLASFLLLLLFYKICATFFCCKQELLFSNNWGWVLVVFQCMFLANNIFYGVNLAGAEDIGAGSPFKIFFNVFQPDLLYLLIVVGLVSNRLFWLNSIVFASSMALRGWMGGFLVVAVLYLCRNYPLKIDGRLFLLLILLLFFGVLIFPFLVELKWVLRADLSLGNVWTNVVDQGYLQSLGDSLTYLLNRFQMFGHVALIAENSDEVASAYDGNEFIPYWADGVVQWFILKINAIEVFQLNRYIVNVFFGSDNLAYSTNPGIAGWFLFLGGWVGVFASYICVVVIFPAYYIFKYAGFKYFLLLFSFVFIYLFHGWFGAYMNIVTYMIAILFVKGISFGRMT